MTHSTQILKYLFLSDENACPFAHLSIQEDVSSLIDFAQRNKCLHVLFHFTKCTRCRQMIGNGAYQKLMKLQLVALSRASVIAEERTRLISMASNIRSRIVFYKQSPVQTPHTTLKVSNDIDVLTSESIQQQLCSMYADAGYVAKVHAPKEVSLHSPSNFSSIDLHTLVAYPHYGNVRDSRHQMIARFSRELYTNARKDTRTGVYVSDACTHLIFLVLYFWYNDLGFGIQTLYVFLSTISTLSDHELTALEALTRDYKIHRLFSFIVHTSHMFFEREIPRSIAKKFRLSIFQSCLSHLFIDNFIVTRLLIRDWDPRDQKIRNLYRKYYLFDLILDENLSPLRLLRLRILRLYISAFASRFCRIQCLRDE